MCSWRGLFFSGLVVVLCGCTHHVSTQTCTKPGSAQCTRNYSMSINSRPDPIDVNTTLPFCFIVPQSPIVKCELNNEKVNNSATTFPSGNNVAVMINDWITVNLNNTIINTFKCEVEPPASAETYYAMFYSLIPGNLVLFVNGTNGSYVEGTNVSIVCRNFNKRPAFQGAEIWTNSSGYVVGIRSLEFVATGDRAGLYTCSVATVPAIPSVSYRILVTSPTTINTTATTSSVLPTTKQNNPMFQQNNPTFQPNNPTFQPNNPTFQQNNISTHSPSISTNAVIIVVVVVMVALIIAITLLVVFVVCFQQKRKYATPPVTASPVFDTTEMSDKISTRDIGFSAIGSNQNDSNYEESDYATVDNNNQVNNNKPSPESPAVHKSSVNEDVQSKGEHLQDVGQLYAVVDKNAKKIAMEKRVGKALDVSGVYSAIDNEADAIIECEESELHDIAELYAVVDKSAKKKISEKQDLSQLYAVVDKSMKSKNIDA